MFSLVTELLPHSYSLFRMLLQSSQPFPPPASNTVITLTLLHPIQSTPVQSWTFDDGEVIRIGRSTDNHVILYSAVVSRNHVELRYDDGQWSVVSLGANGTYIDGNRVARMPLHDGLIFRLARSGPNLQVHLGAVKGVASAVKSSPKPATRIPMPDADEMPQTLGLPGDYPIPIKSQSPLQLAMEQTHVGDEGATEAASQDSQLLFSIKTGQPLKVLQTLGDYQVLKRLGQGETAITSLAWRQGRTVALKQLNDQMADLPAAMKQFQQLATQLQSLNHAGVPRVLEVMERDGKTYLVSEMVYGQTLSQYVTESGPLPQSAAIAWIRELCETLKVMHQQAIVHGNITPHHVIKRSGPRPDNLLCLTDFGAVRLWHWRQSGKFDFTSYLAPEQATEAVLRPAADLYAIGVTLAFLLTGTEPQHFYQQQESGARFDPKLIPGIQPQLSDLLYDLTQPHSSKRPTSASDVLLALDQLA